jgi:glycosyltransferase involved in cell wall biosynthesis
MTSPERTGPDAPRISVIIPIYNVTAHVRACVHSVIAQTLADFEVVLVDDGSTDGSGDAALDAAQGDPRFRLITQDNAGLGAARNTGLAAAAGDFIAFVDSDDRLMPDYLMRLWQTLEETGGDWVACAIQSSDADGTGSRHSAIHGLADLAQHGAPRRYSFDSWSDVIVHFPSAWNKLYRRSLIEGLRFDEGTWFEDHGFFQRVAARTDHIIHLPDALYIQTRGRDGQITTQDTDRVFEQFDVLDVMRQRFADGPHSGGTQALAHIASRLVFERSTIIADPDRRARFAEAARDFLQTNGLDYTTNWDADIGLSWGLEMAGTLPLSVILSWDGTDRDALAHSLDTLRAQTAPAHEVLIVCQSRAAHRSLETLNLPAHWHLHRSPKNSEGTAFNHGIALARGTYIVCVQTGDALTPWTLLNRVEAMMRDDADFGITQMRLHHHDVDPDKITYHNGMLDMALWPAGTPAAGPLVLTPMQALGLEAQCSAKIFRRSFVRQHELAFTSGPRPDWALCLNAAFRAPVTTYMPQAGVTIALRNLGFERWHKPLGARALLHGHKSLIKGVKRTLPAATLATLPQGWERRLFARALREQVYFCDYTGRAARPLMLLGAAGAAWWHGYGPARTAGLDPFVGPRLASLLAPVAVVRRKLGLGGDQTDTATIPNAKTPDTLHAFDLDGTGVVKLRAQFQAAPYANIFFRAAPHGPALFHVSLRHTENLAVCNSQTTTSHWRTEEQRRVDLSAGFADLEIAFGPQQITVVLDGREIFRFASSGLRRRSRFTGTDVIAGFDVEGDLRVSDITAHLPNEAIVFDSRLTLQMKADDAARLRVLPSGTDLPVIPTSASTATALLPAQLWRGLTQGADLTLELAQGAHTHRLILTRDMLRTRIETLLSLPLAFADSTLCLTVLEHVRYASLADSLSPTARQRLDQIAAFYSVQDFLYAEAPAQKVDTPLPAPGTDPVAREVDSALARIAHSQTSGTAQPPDPLDILEDVQVSPQAEALLFLTLAEYFCSGDRNFEGLYQLARRRNVLPLDPQRTRWAMSAALPYAMAARDYGPVVETLRSLALPDGDWLVTAGIAWTVRTAVLRPGTPAQVRHDVFYAFSDLLNKRADNYWERIHCRELTRTAAALIVNRNRLEPKQYRDAVILCLRIYGLSRQFWADLEDFTDLPAELITARVAFDCVMSPDATADARDSALHLFETAKTVDAPRLRREIFGPAGLPRLAASDTAHKAIDLGDLAAMRTNTGEAFGKTVLRHMASPNTAPVTPAVAQLATIALPTLYPNTRRAPYFATQQMLTRQARDLPGPDLAGTLDSLTQLSDAGSCYLGFGMALALIDRLHDTAPQTVQKLCVWMQEQLAQQGTQDGWRAAPAFVQPLRRLGTRATLLPDVQSLINLLDITVVPAAASDNAGLPAGDPLFDTIVTVFSCVTYLDTRIPAMRNGWLSLLEELGVPYVVIVGDGNGRREGDIVHLDAPDDYEGLPQKTLAAIRWVHDNTRFGHMLKIDDDCFLNAPLFFGALSYRKFDYYGRRLYRAVGQMDRKWHQSKSSSARGQLDLDKSPEPSEYADGGTAYALSRTAMAAALEAADSTRGRALIAVSFMEDKMLGDLLALRGIRPNDEDYRISLRRRTYSAATPVALWQNSFHASATADLQLVHLDTHLDQASALARLDTPGLWPRKIWPSYQDVKLGYQSNALELVSSEASVERARDADVAVVACMRNEMFMLPHFLAHYRKLGVEAFLIADNCSDDGTLEYLQQQTDVALFSVDTDYKLSHYGVAWQQAMISAFRLDKWSLVADADELLVWQEKQSQTLGDLLKTPDFRHANAARIFMLDMYPQGPLEGADFADATPFEQAGFADRVPFLSNTLSRGPYSNQPSWTSALRHRLIAGSAPSLFVAQKMALLRYCPWMRLSAGLHFVNDVDIAPRELLFAHFKYNADFRRKAQAEVLRGQHFNDAEEYRKYLALTSEGRSVIHDPDLSRPWADVPFVKQRLSQSDL